MFIKIDYDVKTPIFNFFYRNQSQLTSQVSICQYYYYCDYLQK